MDRQTFESEMTKAETFRLVGDRPDYWMGYRRGLRRAFHGEKFGTSEEHILWSSLTNDDDPNRRELGLGYQDGLVVVALV